MARWGLPTARLFAPLRVSAPAKRHLSASSCIQAAYHPKRGSYKQLNAQDVEAFAGMLSNPTSSILSSLSSGPVSSVSEDELQPYNQDWMAKYAGETPLVLRPKSTEEVSKIVAYCHQHNIAITPQGGNTGLVGGSVPVHDEIILNLGLMDNIRSFDEVSGILKLDAGAILQTTDDFLASKGFIFPLDLGAKGSCQVGGNLSTNAGGLRLLRYGSLHGSVLGVEAVLPDAKGTVLSVGMNGLRKDNTGYDLKQLFIGAEGTLGVVTGLTILAPRRSSSVNVALLAMPAYENILGVFQEARSHLGEILSAFEFFDQQSMDLVLHHTGQNNPMEVEGNMYYVLIETSGSNKEHDDEKVTGLLEAVMEQELVVNGILAESETQVQAIWGLREGITESIGKLGKAYKYDLSLPVADMYECVDELRRRVSEAGFDKDGSVKAVLGYGHVGDGNIHLNLAAEKFEAKLDQLIEPWIYEWVASKNGSISAEHGLGLMKAPYVGYSQTPEAIDYMRKVKAIFDEKSIMNPYKYLLPKNQDADISQVTHAEGTDHVAGGIKPE